MEKHEIKCKDKIRTFITVKKDEKCPICGNQFNDFTWNVFHGEVTSHCCGICLQIKDYYVDEEETKEYKEFVKKIGSDELGYILNIEEKYIKPLKQIVKEHKIKNIQTNEVFNLVQQILEEEKEK